MIYGVATSGDVIGEVHVEPVEFRARTIRADEA